MWYNKTQSVYYTLFKCPRAYVRPRLTPHVSDNYTIALRLWYNEENYEFVELETLYDYENSTVSIETTHFSRYMVVDKYLWYEAWAVEFNYNPAEEGTYGEPTIRYNTVLAIDCSGSMSSNDPITTISGIDSLYESQHSKTCQRIKAVTGFINNMNDCDKAAVVLFTGSAYEAAKMTNDAETLRLALQKISSNGDTSFNAAISTSINAFNADDIGAFYTNNRIILLSDGGSSVSDSILDTAKSKNIKIYTIGLGSSSNDTRLEYIANYTGGEFFKAYTADELIDIYTEVGINSDFDTTDTDGDGLYDAVETAGIRLQNGIILKNKPETDTFYANPTKLDTDGDGLNDGVEIDPTIRWKSGSAHSGQREYFFVMLSNPGDKDSDGDGILDAYDIAPLEVETDPLSPCNVESVEFINIPSDHYGQPDFTISLVKSEMYSDKIFFANATGITNTGGFLVTDDLKDELERLENGYQGHFLATWASTNEAAAHAAKQETDQLVPRYFDYGSTAYYGCWAYNYQAELFQFSRTLL